MIRKIYIDMIRRKAAEGRLLWIFRGAARYALTRLSARVRRPLCGPILGTLVTNYTCNLRCRMCDIPTQEAAQRRRGRRPYDTGEMLALVDGFAELGTLGIGFTGGEPLLRPDIWDLVDRCRGRGMLTHLNTNATLLDAAAIRRMLETGVDSLNISLDGATAETHERIRGVPGSYARTMEAVRAVVAAKRAAASPLRVKLVMVLQEENAAEVGAFLALAESVGVECVELIPRQPFRADATPGVPADPALVQRAEGLARELRGRRGGVPLEDSPRMLDLFGPTFRAEPSPLRCLAAWSSLGADCYGRLFPCVPFINWDRPFATIAAPGDLPAAWRARGAGWRDEVSRCRACTLNCQAELNILLDPFRRRG